MKIKFNWGTGIVLFIILFLGTVALRIFLSYQHDINLVSQDYYPEEIAYEERIEKERNTQNLAEKVKIEKDNNLLKIVFPPIVENGIVSGKVHFYYPADYQSDTTIVLKLEENSFQVVETNEFTRGRYILKIDWKLNETKFYQEIEISL